MMLFIPESFIFFFVSYDCITCDCDICDHLVISFTHPLSKSKIKKSKSENQNKIK